MIYDAIHGHIWPDRPINTLKSVFVFQNESSSNAALDGLYLSWSEIPKPVKLYLIHRQFNSVQPCRKSLRYGQICDADVCVCM